jgi:hypothetical protein
VVDLRDENSEENELEGMEKLLENIFLALGGTTAGAYFSDVLRMRHHLRTLMTTFLAFMAGTFAKIKKNKKQ